MAIDLKQKYNAYITAVSMGPSKSMEILKEAIALGVDDAILLSDSKFIGSDTCATSRVLAAFIEKKYPNTDLILFGQSAIDGETSQTGVSTAQRLNLPCISYVNEIINIQDALITAISQTETEKTTYKAKLPTVLCINNYVNKPSLPKIEGYIKAKDYNYKTYNIFDLGLSDTQTGVKGSPTYVSKVYKMQEYRNCQILDTAKLLETIKEAANGT